MASDDIQGTITDSGGSAISGATVALWLQDNPNQVKTTTTDASGNYLFEEHPDADGTSQNWHLAARDPNDSTRQFRSLHTVSASLPFIPDSGDLQARYDFSEEDGSLPVEDQTGNGYSLDSGKYTGVGESINGNQAGEFDGIDDRIYTTWTEEPQPNHIFIVYQHLTDPSNNTGIIDSGETTNHKFGTDGGGNRDIYAGSPIDGSNEDTNPHVASVLFDAGSSELRIDGSRDISGDAGSDGLTGFSIGAQRNDSNFANVAFGEVLVYPMDKSDKVGDVEQYLEDKWGITI